MADNRNDGLGGVVGRIDRLAEMLSLGALVLAQLILAGMALLISAEVVCRSFLGFSLLIVNEMVGYMLVAVIFLGLSFTLRRGLLLRVAVIYDRLPHRARPLVDFVFNLGCLWFAAVLAWQLVQLTMQSYALDVTSVTLMATPLFVPQLVMSAGAVVFLLTVATATLTSLARMLAVLAGRDLPEASR